MRAAHDTLVTALDRTDGAGGYGEEQSDMFPTNLSRYREELAAAPKGKPTGLEIGHIPES